jgi:hypothetical protein
MSSTDAIQLEAWQHSATAHCTEKVVCFLKGPEDSSTSSLCPKKAAQHPPSNPATSSSCLGEPQQSRLQSTPSEAGRNGCPKPRQPQHRRDGRRSAIAHDGCRSQSGTECHSVAQNTTMITSAFLDDAHVSSASHRCRDAPSCTLMHPFRDSACETRSSY